MASACGGGPTSPTVTAPPVTPPPVVVVPPPVASAPTLSCPAAQTGSTLSSTGVSVTYSTPAATGGQAPVTVACTPASGTTFPIGTTTVSCVATDQLSRTATCGFAVSVTRTRQLSRTKFLAFGDSITAGEVVNPTAAVGGTDRFPIYKFIVVPTASYPTVLQSSLMSGYPSQTTVMVNAGLSGEAAADSTTLPRLTSALIANRPEVVLLLSGYNDLLGLGPQGVNDVAAISAINAMAAEARGRNARVFIATVTPNRPGLRRSIPTSLLQSFNDRLRNVARGENAVLVDLYAALAGDVTTYIGSDGLHPTEAGYRKMAEAFFTAIQAALEVP